MYGRVAAQAVAAVTVLLAVAACTHTVDGAAQRVHLDGADHHDHFGYADDRCGLLADSTVGDILAADHVVRAYYGPVCQYVLTRDGATVDVTYSWFAAGSLERERRLAEDRGAEVAAGELHRHQAFRARRDVTGAACAATAGVGADGSGPGVLSWWVQYRGASDGDPCADAEKLLAATLSSAM
ncbi:DUF3558 family protein [Mycolicibacterium thermoresistibile]